MKGSLWSVFILILVLLVHGCGDAPQTPGSGYIDISMKAGSPPVLTEVWKQIAAEGSFDGESARLQEVTLTCTARVARLDLNVDAVTSDGRLINVTVRQADAAGDARLHIAGDIGSNHSVHVPTTGLVAPMLTALDRVGIGALIHTSNNGESDLYAIHFLQDTSDGSPGIPTSSPAYRWDGSRFVAMPANDPGRARDTADLFVAVFPLRHVASSETGSTQSRQTTTTNAYQSLSPTYFVIPL